MSTKKYKSEINPKLVYSFGALLVVLTVLLTMVQNWSGLVVTVLVAAFFVHLMLDTYYQITNDQLRIKSGFLVNKTIPIRSITHISETRNPMSAPALSLNRLEIKYNRFDRILVSPRDRTGFIADLLKVSEHIQVKVADN